MRRQMIRLAVLAVAVAPLYATDISPALAAYYASLGINMTQTTAQVVSQPIQTPTQTVNTTSPYSGFTSSGTPTNTYTGTVSTVVSPTTSTGNSALDAYYRSLGITSTVVNNTTTTTTQQYTPQVITTVPTSSTGVSTAGMSPALLAYYQSLGLYGGVTASSSPSPTFSSPGVSVQGISNPEPGTILMMAGGLAGVILLRKKLHVKAIQ